MSEEWQTLDVSPEVAAILNGLIKSARDAGERRGNKLAGGASATYFNGMLVICHPDIPPHIWNGKTMTPLTFGAP